MSIITDALKKAEQKGSSSAPLIPIFKSRAAQKKSTNLKNKSVLPLSAVLIIALGLFLFVKNKPVFNLKKPPVYRSLTQQKPANKKSLPGLKPKAINTNSFKYPPLELNGIVQGEKESWILINNNIMRKDETIDGGKLTNIGKDFVELSYPDRTITLQLKK